MTVGRPIVVGADLVGTDVNIAARLTEAATADQVLVTEVAREALGDALPGVRMVDRGCNKLKGLDALVAASEAQRRP